MRWKSKLLAVVLGLVFLGGGLWPLGLLCFVYLLLPARSRTSSGEERGAGRRNVVSWRLVAGFVLFFVAGIAHASGGTLSPAVFTAAATVTIAWPSLGRILPLGEVDAMRDSILLRSKYLPLSWHAVAELKPGAEPFPRAASSFEGRLAIFTETGKAYLLAACFAFSRNDAELRLLHLLKSTSPHREAGAFLLPLDSISASEVFRLRLSRVHLSKESIADATPAPSGLLLLDCSRGKVVKAAAYAVHGPAPLSRIPNTASDLESAPLVWEVLEALGKKVAWPDPDAVSNLLDSFVATRGVPLGERLKNLEDAGDALMVRSLAGEEFRMPRPQLRALVSIYS